MAFECPRANAPPSSTRTYGASHLHAAETEETSASTSEEHQDPPSEPADNPDHDMTDADLSALIAAFKAAKGAIPKNA